MEYLLLLSAMATSAVLSIMSTLFGKRNNSSKNISYLYSVFVTFSAMIVWGFICLTGEGINAKVFIYSLLYGLSYTSAMVGMFNAYRVGSVSITAFIKQLSLIMVSVWGFIFWDNPITSNIIIGIVLIIISLYFCFKPNKSAEHKTLSAKWCLYALMLLAGNAGCSIIQKYQQIAFNEEFGSSLMFFGTAVSFVISLLLSFKKGTAKISDISKKTLIFPIIGGMSSAFLNLFILLLFSSVLSESIIFPGIAVGGLVITTLFSLIVYKEKLKLHQWCGLFIGTIALVFLNIG